MNPVRILIVSNRYLLCVGFAVKEFSRKFKIYQRSIRGTIVFVLLNLLYLMCLYEHYTKTTFLENIRDFSKTIYYSLYTHLFLGIIGVCVMLYDFNAFSEYSAEVVQAIPKQQEVRPKFDRLELFVYYRTFINLFVFTGIVAYDLTIIDLESLTRSKAMLFIALYYPHCALGNCIRYFTIQMALLKTVCQNLNKRLSDIQLAHEFRHHGLFFEYINSERIANGIGKSQCTSMSTWNSSRPIATINDKYEAMKMQDSVFFQKWWNTIRNRNHSPRKTDVIQMLDAIASNEFLLKRLKNIFSEYDHFMKLYRKLEGLIQKQMFLLVCQHTVIVGVAIYIFMEIYLEWGDLMGENDIKLAKVNFTTHLIQIVHDFGCLAITAIICRTEIRDTRSIATKLMAMPFADNVRCAVSYFYFKLQSFRENVYAFNMFTMDVYSCLMVILQYTVVGTIYALYQYFDIKLEDLKTAVDTLNSDDE